MESQREAAVSSGGASPVAPLAASPLRLLRWSETGWGDDDTGVSQTRPCGVPSSFIYIQAL